MRNLVIAALIGSALAGAVATYGATPLNPPDPCRAPNPAIPCNPSPVPTNTVPPTPTPTPTALPSSGHILVWANDDVQNGAVYVPADQVQAATDIVENQLQGQAGKAYTDCDLNYTGGSVGPPITGIFQNQNSTAYAGAHNPSWCRTIEHYQANAMPAGSESGSTCTGTVNPPFSDFYGDVSANRNGLSESNAVLHGKTPAAVTTRINKNFKKPNLGCNGSTDNFLQNYGTAVVRQATMICQNTLVGDTKGDVGGFPGTGVSGQTYDCEVGFDTSDYVMYDNNHVTINRTCGACNWTASIEGVSDDNYSGGANNSGYCIANLCTSADLGTTLDHNHTLLYNNDLHRDGATPWKIFINQMQDAQTSNNVTPRCTDLIGGFNNGSNNVVLIQLEDGFEDTGNDETMRYNPWQWAFSLNSMSCILYNGINSTTMGEVHQVDDYVTGCSAGSPPMPTACSQTTINNNRMTYLGLLWLYFEPSRTPAGEEVVQNGGKPLSCAPPPGCTNDHYVLSSFPEDWIFPAGPLASMQMYNVPQVAKPARDGSGCSRLDSLADHGAVDLLVDALHSGGPQNSVTCGWSNITVVHSGDGTNNNKAVGMYERQFIHCYQYVATMSQALARTGTWTDRGQCASIVLAAQSTGANSTPRNMDDAGQMVPCNTSIGSQPFASGGVGDNTIYAHMMTLATFTTPGGFMGVASNDPGTNSANGCNVLPCGAGTPTPDPNFSRANGPNDANVTGASFVCYNGSNMGTATVVSPGQAIEVFQ